jgi:hypothetical protein
VNLELKNSVLRKLEKRSEETGIMLAGRLT